MVDVSYDRPLNLVCGFSFSFIVTVTRLWKMKRDRYLNEDWLTFSNRVTFHICIMVYKTFNNLAPTYLSELFTPTSNIHDRGLRSIENETLRVPFARTKYYENSFTVCGAKAWNLLPLELRQTNTLSSFKPKLKTFLLAQ